MKLTGGGLVTSTLDSVRMANRGTDRSIRWLLEVVHLSMTMDSPPCSGAAPSHHSLGLVLAARVRFRLTALAYVSSVGQSRRAFLHTLFSCTLLISLVMNNIVSTLQMRMLNEKKKYL